MYTRLQQKLLSLLPLYNKNNEELYKCLSDAADELASVEWDLTPEEADMARRFVARIVYEFMSSLEGKRVFQINLGYASSKDFKKAATGFEPTFKKLGGNPVTRVHLENILQMLWGGRHQEFLQLTRLDSYYGKHRWTFKRFLLRIIFFPIVLFYWLKRKIEPFSPEKLAISLLILLYATVSGKTWAVAVQWLANTPWKRHPGIQDLITKSGFNVVAHKEGLSHVYKMVSALPWRQKYLMKGALGQLDDDIVDELVSELPTASPPIGMRITNALILASQRNPYAVQRFIDVVTNRDKYPEAVQEISLIKEYLQPISRDALKAMLDEAYALPTEKRNSYKMSRQTAAHFLLNTPVGFGPDAFEYLLNIIETGRNTREVIIALETFRNFLNQADLQSQPGTFEPLVASACTLIKNTEILHTEVSDIDFEALDARAMAVKFVLQVTSLAPLDMHQVLLLEVVNSLLSCKEDIIDKLRGIGVEEYIATKLADIWLLGEEHNWLSLLSEIDNILARTFLEVVYDTSDSILALVFLEEEGRPSMGEFYKVAEYFTRLFQSQIVSTATLSSDELSEVEEIQKRDFYPFLLDIPPTLNNFMRVNRYLQNIREKMKQEIEHRIERRKKKERELYSES